MPTALSRMCILLVTLLIPSAGALLPYPARANQTPISTHDTVSVVTNTITIPDSRIVSLSPDGTWIAAVRPITGYQRGELCVFDVATGDERSCADLSGLDAGLRMDDITWSPDGSHLAFSEN